MTKVKVWDIYVRIFHWTLVASFLITFVTNGIHFYDFIHFFLGYLIFGLLVFRLIWGFVGTQYAKWWNFIYKPTTIFNYAKAMLNKNPPHYLGHNPLAGLMVFSLIFMLLIDTLSGMSLAALGGQGPLAPWQTGLVPYTLLIRQVHEIATNLTLILVLMHIAGVVISSYLEKQNLAAAMITGQKELNHD